MLRQLACLVAMLAVCGTPRTFASATAEPAARFVAPGANRTFLIEYVAHIPAAPAHTRKIRVWLPVPQTTPVQTIRDLDFSAPPRLTRGTKHGNGFAYWEFDAADRPGDLTMRFTCTRQELRTDLARLAAAGDGVDQTLAFAAFRQPSRLAVVDERTRALAQQITRGAPTTLEKAHAIYAYVLGHMRYDKSQPGWGTGSTAFACEEGRGNCTDFHSLFDSLCQSAAIAAEFEIGLLLPYDHRGAEKLGGYHCWTYFRVPGRTWVPVDCSEAWLQPKLRDYLFGNSTANRVTLSVGRDLMLVPEQSGPPLNYFVDPYVEADGQPIKATKTWTFTESD